MAFTPPTVTVLDLTARLGLHALTQLGVANPSGPGPWLQVPLADASVAPMIDWLRPASAKDLQLPSPASAAIILLVGPGSVNLVRATLEWLAPQSPAVVWAFLMPNALMEDAVFKTTPASQTTLPGAPVAYTLVLTNHEAVARAYSLVAGGQSSD